jgi:hypothetical protein
MILLLSPQANAEMVSQIGPQSLPCPCFAVLQCDAAQTELFTASYNKSQKHNRGPSLSMFSPQKQLSCAAAVEAVTLLLGQYELRSSESGSLCMCV